MCTNHHQQYIHTCVCVTKLFFSMAYSQQYSDKMWNAQQERNAVYPPLESPNPRPSNTTSPPDPRQALLYDGHTSPRDIYVNSPRDVYVQPRSPPPPQVPSSSSVPGLDGQPGELPTFCCCGKPALRCCACISLRTAMYILGVWYVICAISSLSSGIVALSHPKNEFHEYVMHDVFGESTTTTSSTSSAATDNPAESSAGAVYSFCMTAAYSLLAGVTIYAASTASPVAATINMVFVMINAVFCYAIGIILFIFSIVTFIGGSAAGFGLLLFAGIVTAVGLLNHYFAFICWSFKIACESHANSRTDRSVV
eukprot:GHVQ01032027.1.p1 GENE.GHVQ01032027.1~~GHVQ01032027.1.p1  ORF type:complete len:310 (-),score=37.93 GHVQ01032027.1:485-1414(-)